jgi:hypothetical protein
MKILLVGAELFHADGQTDMTKLIVTFRNFANAPMESGCDSTEWLNVSDSRDWYRAVVDTVMNLVIP